MNATAQNGLAEWRRYWPLPIAAGLGYSIGVIQVYALGAFMGPLTAEFGWSRAEASAGLTIVGIVSAIAAFPVGLLVDRIGPRPIGMIGAILMGLSFALFGAATGTIANWLLLWSILAFATIWVHATVWTSSVATRFEQSRGLAFAVTLTGASLTALILPRMSVAFIENYGWRNAFVYLGAIWGAVVFVALLLFFRGARDQARKKDAPSEAAQILSGLKLTEGLRSFAFYKLLLAALLFTFTIMGLVVHLVPMLTDAGATPEGAASIAGLIGIFSIIGRLGMGFLLDRFPARVVGALAYLVPIPACVLLLLDGANPLSQTVAAALIGLTVGAEVDVIAYLTSRHFGLKNFGGLFGCMVAALALGTAFGPLVAGYVFDSYGVYAPFIVSTIVLMSLSSLAIASLKPPPFAHGEPPAQLGA